MKWLLAIFLITLFVPKSVALQLGSISLTPALASAIVLFPVLVTGRRIKLAWPDAIVILFYLATLYSTLLSVPASEGIESFGRRVLAGIVPYLVGRYLGSRPKMFSDFMRVLMTVMAILACFLLLESLYRFNIHSYIWAEPYAPHHEKRMGLTRAYGWTSHSIMLGVSYAVLVPVMMIAAIEKINKLGNFRWLKLGLLMVGVFCSLSTGAWLPAAISVAMVVYDYFKFISPGARWMIFYVGGASSYYILEVLSGRPLLRILMMELHLSSPMAWYYRWRLYERVYAVMPGFEWFGHGNRTPANMVDAWQWSIDNNYLMVLMQFGRVGLTLWIAIPIAVLIYGWKSVWNAPDTPYRRIARAVMFAMVTVGLTQLSVALFSTASMLNWLFMGLAIGMAQGLAALPAARGKRTKRPKASDKPVRGGSQSGAPQTQAQ
jgi:hypothetical protein